MTDFPLTNNQYKVNVGKVLGSILGISVGYSIFVQSEENSKIFSSNFPQPLYNQKFYHISLRVT